MKIFESSTIPCTACARVRQCEVLQCPSSRSFRFASFSFRSLRPCLVSIAKICFSCPVVIHAPVYQCTSRVCIVVLVGITGFRVVGSWRCFVTPRESLKELRSPTCSLFGYHIGYGRSKSQGKEPPFSDHMCVGEVVFLWSTDRRWHFTLRGFVTRV